VEPWQQSHPYLSQKKQEPIVKEVRVRKQKTERQAFPINKHVIDRIIFPVKTKRGLKWGKKRQSLPDQQQEPTRQHPIGKLLDGFLILLSCRVKLPHEAIRSRLNS